MRNHIDVPLSSAAFESVVVQVRLTGVKRFKIRVAIALVLLRIVSWIAPFTFSVESEE